MHAPGVLLGLGAALGLGVGDFLGGYAARARAVLRVVLAAHGTGLAGMALLVVLLRPPAPTWTAVSLAAFAGLVGGAATMAFYAALARGRMGAASTLSALLSAVVPVLWGWSTREAPTVPRVLGVLVAFLAIALLTREEGRPDRTTLRLATFAGFGFGTFLVLLSEAGAVASPWPVMITRVFSVAMFLLAATRLPRGGRGGFPWWGAVAGLCDTAANLVFVYGAAWAQLDLVATLAALYPVFTIGLAVTLLGERPSRWQWAGVAVAAVAVTLFHL